MLKLPAASMAMAGSAWAPLVNVFTWKVSPAETLGTKSTWAGSTVPTGVNCRAKMSATLEWSCHSGISLCQVITKSPSTSMATAGFV